MRVVVSLLFSLALLLASPSVFAADAPDGESAPFRPTLVRRTYWYGWQTLIVDGASILVVFVPEGAALGAAGYLVGGPVVHASHGNWWRAGGSLGLRIGLPVAGGGIGAALADCSDAPNGFDFCPLGQIAAGALVGMAAAITLDAAVLAYGKEDRFTDASSSWATTMTLVDGGARWGLVGRW